MGHYRSETCEYQDEKEPKERVAARKKALANLTNALTQLEGLRDADEADDVYQLAYQHILTARALIKADD